MVPAPVTVAPSARYLDLINIHPLRPIRSNDELDRASVVADGLLDRELLDRDEIDYLEVLSALIELYETAAHPIPRASVAETLRFLIEARDVSPSEVAEETQIAEATIVAILAGELGISRHQIGSLARYFHVDPSVFMSA